MISHLYKKGFSQLYIDLPGFIFLHLLKTLGFGRSSGRDIQTRIWKKHGPEIVCAVLDAYTMKDPVNIDKFHLPIPTSGFSHSMVWRSCHYNKNTCEIS